MKKNRGLRIAAALGAIILMVLVASIANSFLGNPVSASKATKASQLYVNEKYPELNLKAEKARYNFKFGEYYSKAASPDHPDVHFEVIYRKNKVTYDGYESSVLGGYNTQGRFSQERTNEIKALLVSKYEDNLAQRCFVEFEMDKFQELFNRGDIKVNQPYYKEFKCDTRLYADFKIEEATPENIARHLIELNSFLIEQGYEIDDFIGDYMDGSNKGYSISVDKNMINDNLAGNIQKAIADRDSVSRENLSVYPYRK